MRAGNAIRRLVCVTSVFCAAFFPWASTAAEGEARVLVLRAPVLHTGDGRVVEDAVVIARDGRIAAAGSGLATPEGATVIEVEGGSITPGLIDANAVIEPADTVPSTRRIAAAGTRDPRAAGADRDGRREATDFLRRFFGADHDHSRLAAGEEEGECPVCSGAHPEEEALASGVRNRVTGEQASEIVPHTRVLDAIDLASPDFDRLARGGVTTVYASTDSSAVIGARGAVLKTGGACDRRVVRAAAAVKAVMGRDATGVGSSNRPPSRFSRVSMYARRPTTRMGVTWVFRKAFHDTLARRRGLPVRGADTPSEEASAVLGKVLDGDVPLRVQARALQDIETTLRLCGEFGLTFTLEEGVDAHRCVALLRARSVPVIFGPFADGHAGPRQYSLDSARERLFTPRALLDGGVVTALSARDLRDEDGLARQAMAAIRYGLGLEEALAAVTSTPARLLGIDEAVGTVAEGKDADLVLWNGPPFASTSMPVVVVIGGAVVLDRRKE